MSHVLRHEVTSIWYPKHQDAEPSVAGSLEPVVPRSLRFMTVGGEQLTAFHKPTDPFHPIALYEDIMEPALGVGEAFHICKCSPCQAMVPMVTMNAAQFLSNGVVTANRDGIKVHRPAYIAGLAVQSWLNGWNPQPSSCPPRSLFRSLNIRRIYIRQALRGWPSTCDHAKWALAMPPLSTASAEGISAVCISDMNRMLGQMVRGGGAVCFTRRPALWQSFRGIIDAIEGCFLRLKA